jgi:hypothetical protein
LPIDKRRPILFPSFKIGYNIWVMSNIKKCTKCGRELPLDQFYRKKLKGGRVGYKSRCKVCMNAANTEWRKNNPEKRRAQNARCYKNNLEKCKATSIKWHKNNPEKTRAAKAKWRKNNSERARSAVVEWNRKNPEKLRAINANYQRERRAVDSTYKLMKNIGAAMSTALKGNVKHSHTAELIGCSVECLRYHLEGQFVEGMTWDNYGRYGWHIDHIIPLSYFDFSDPEEQKRAWHYTNLQPLWAADNLRKSNKIEERQLILL